MNRAILCGNLVADPQFATSTNGVSLCKFTIAVQRKFKSNSGESEADFINIITWRGIADNCSKYLHKGNKVGVVGSIQTRNYDAQDGTKRYVTEIVADEVEFLTQKQENANKPQTEASEKQQALQGFTPIPDSQLPF